MSGCTEKVLSGFRLAEVCHSVWKKIIAMSEDKRRCRQAVKFASFFGAEFLVFFPESARLKHRLRSKAFMTRPQ